MDWGALRDLRGLDAWGYFNCAEVVPRRFLLCVQARSPRRPTAPWRPPTRRCRARLPSVRRQLVLEADRSSGARHSGTRSSPGAPHRSTSASPRSTTAGGGWAWSAGRHRPRRPVPPPTGMHPYSYCRDCLNVIRADVSVADAASSSGRNFGAETPIWKRFAIFSRCLHQPRQPRGNRLRELDSVGTSRKYSVRPTTGVVGWG